MTLNSNLSFNVSFISSFRNESAIGKFVTPSNPVELNNDKADKDVTMHSFFFFILLYVWPFNVT